MRDLRIAIVVVGILTVLPALGFAQPGAATSPSMNNAAAGRSSAEAKSPTSAANTTMTVHATKGIVKFVDAHKLVVRRRPQEVRERTFVLNPSTERSGVVKVGSTVDIRYRSDGDKQIATAVTVVHASNPPSVSGSHS
jgi:hypothetical protein